jgi:hypothetical protein
MLNWKGRNHGLIIEYYLGISLQVLQKINKNLSTAALQAKFQVSDLLHEARMLNTQL